MAEIALEAGTIPDNGAARYKARSLIVSQSAGEPGRTTNDRDIV